MRTKYPIGVLLLCFASAAWACNLQPLDAGGASANTSSILGVTGDPPDSGWAQCGSPTCDNADGTIPLLTYFPPIYLPDGGTTTDPCEAVEGKSMQIRQDTCAECHSPPLGLGNYDWVTDDDQLVHNKGAAGQALVIPGDPANSPLYKYVAAGLNPNFSGMPPPGMQPRPTTEDVSVLYQWIMCLGDAGAGPRLVYGTGDGGGPPATDGGSGLPSPGDAWVGDGAMPTRTLDASVGDSGTMANSSGRSGGSSSGGSGGSSSDGSVSGSSSSGSVSLHPNLVTNGTFANGTTGWAVVYGTATQRVMGSELCVTIPPGVTTVAVLGWPQPAGTSGANIVADVPYTFAYTARATRAPLTVLAKVSQTAAPYTVDVQGTDPVGPVPSAFSHIFTSATGDPSAGVSFSFSSVSPQSVCFSNVSLVEGT